MTKFLMQLNACPASVSCQDGCVLAGAKMVVSQSYARIFFRNCVSTYVSVHHALSLSPDHGDLCTALYSIDMNTQLCTAEAKYTQSRQMSASVIF